MFLDKLQAGFLLFETEQGLVRVELTPRQRIYLLWTFRNFRQLSVPLLNLRERALVNALFRNNAGVVSESLDQLPVIGVVENFVPSEAEINALPSPQLAPKPIRKEEQREQAEAQRVEVAPKPKPAPSSSPVFAWSQLSTSELAPCKPAAPKFAISKLATSRLATAASAVSLCVISVVALNRIQTIPSSQAHSQPRLEQISAVVPPSSAQLPAKPAAVAESPSVIAPPPAPAQTVAAPEAAAIAPASIAAVVPTIIPTHVPARAPLNIPTPKRAMRVHHAASTPNAPATSEDSSIQASRPPLRFAYPVYTDVRARGAVALTASVDPDGAVRSVRMVSGKRALAAAAVRAVRQWRYRPYLKDGQPVATETNIVISFFSDDAISVSFPPSIPAIR